MSLLAAGLNSGTAGVDTRGMYYQDLKSRIHQDLMLGTTDVDVSGRTRRGTKISIMSGGEWKI